MYILVTLPYDEQFLQAVREIAGEEAEIVYKARPEVTAADTAPCDVILGNVPAGSLSAAAGLSFYQLNSAGYDAYSAPGILPAGATMCNASGAYGIAISEHMLGQLLMLLKHLSAYEDNRKKHLWQDAGNVETIYGSTTLVIGAGDIGDNFGRRVHALGSRVIGIRRSTHHPADYMYAAGTTADIDRYLPEADFVFCALPENEETIHFFNEERILKMKTGAVLMNVGRGSLIETEALVKALHSGKLGGACIDVTEPEPLPAESPLWDCPNLVLTPHTAGAFHARVTTERIQGIMLDNLRAYLTGEPLKNIVRL